MVATGINTIPNIPKLTGAELFKGDYLHSRSFKRYGIFLKRLYACYGLPAYSLSRPESFKDKRVLVVGLGNTGADTIHSLRGIASKIYVSHSHGAYIVRVPQQLLNLQKLTSLAAPEHQWQAIRSHHDVSQIQHNGQHGNLLAETFRIHGEQDDH